MKMRKIIDIGDKMIDKLYQINESLFKPVYMRIAMCMVRHFGKHSLDFQPIFCEIIWKFQNTKEDEKRHHSVI